MIKYLENRVWSLNAKIIKTDAYPEEVNRQLQNKLTEGIFADGGILFDYAMNPIGNYSLRQTEVTLSLTEKSISKYQLILDEKAIELTLSSFRMIINIFGFLNIIPIFTYTGDPKGKNLSDIEANGDASAEIIDGLFSDIAVLMDALDDIGIIRKSPDYHFGIPSVIEKHDVHTKDDSYNYLAHIFFIDENEALAKTVKLYQAKDSLMTFDDHNLYAVFPLYFWDMSREADDLELVKLVSIDSYMTSELVAVNNALHVYNSFLDVLNQGHDLDSNHLRKIFNYNTWLVQNLRLFNPNFTLHQFRFIKMYRDNSDIGSKYELLKDAEHSLTFAIEGVEVTRTQQSARIMQFILALFTALTLYSVITDVYGFITNTEQQFYISIYSLRTIIFLLATVVVVSFVLFFRKITRKI
jgi:hypothetical protein